MSDEENRVLPFRGPEPVIVMGGESPYFLFGASLRIFGADLPLQSITERLGREPDHIHRAGEKAGPRSPGYKHDMWSLASPLPESAPLSEHLEWLYDTLRQHFDYLKSLKSLGTVDVFCGYRSNSGTAGFEVPCSALRLFIELEVPFGVSVIVIEGDD